MTTLFKNFRKYFLIVCIAFTLFACSRISQENFDKIKPGMTMQEVTAILGEPSTSEAINIGGISGNSAAWKDSKSEISIQFLNDRVTIKSFNRTPDGQ